MNAPEQQLRTELRAESELITPGSLRPLDLSQAQDRASVGGKASGRRRPQLAWLAPVAAAVSVAVITAVVAIGSLYGPNTGPEPGAAGRPTAGFLQGVAAFSARDVWAVGSLDIGQTRYSNLTSVPLIVHWNGSKWRQYPEPTLRGSDEELNSIAGTSPDNLWAVGVRDEGASPFEPLIMHWNGHAWQLQRFKAATKAGRLNAVAARSATDAWAVGQTGGHVPGALILHWNGRTWNQVPAPASEGTLLSVTAISASDAWAVGSRANNGQEIMHWNGSSWAQVPDPHLRGVPPVLRDVVADSAGTVWVAGFAGGQHPAALLLRWTGTSWQRVAVPKMGPVDRLAAIDILSSRDIWAVGGGSAGPKTVILHWNGVAWTRMITRGTMFTGGLNGLAAGSPSDIWAVGFRGSYFGGVPQVLHWNGSNWKRVYGPASTKGLHENSSCGPYSNCSG